LFKLLKFLTGVCILIALTAAAWLYWYAHQPVALRASPADFSIKPGSGLRQAARQLSEQGVDVNIEPFVVLGRLLGRAANIKAGSYEVTAGLTPLSLLDKLTSGDVSQSSIALIEGWTFHEMLDALAHSPDLQHDTMGMTDADIMARLGAAGELPEGWFFPDTYLFGKGASDLAVLRRAHRAMQARLQTAWEGRDPATPYARPYDALIMASIVEKETGRATDRALVASVFVNRLRTGMLLQTDPTVIYGLGDKFDGNLRKRDLVSDTAYNTYTRPGLPPTPIAMPGLASLYAATNPAKSDMFYFVSRNDGSSQFSRNLAEHNRAVQKYQLNGQKH
jgi:UPF0755 protein